MKNRRRSVSATRLPLESAAAAANFVGRIGASLRISARRRSKPNFRTDVDPQELSKGEDQSSGWLRFSRFDAYRGRDHSPIEQDRADDIDSELGILMPQLQGASRSTAPSPQPSSHYGLVGTRSLGARSCPSTPQMSRRYMKEGSTQLTSLTTLLTHHRYFFLFNDVLLISKQKAENSYKLKEKVPLHKLWLASNNCTHSFLIGWPNANYVAHFDCESVKNSWFDNLSECINRKFRPGTTTITVAVQVDGRQQNIRKEVRNSVRSSEILAELITELSLSPNPQHYELCYENRALHGIENVYIMLMDKVERLGVPLSHSQLTHLDTSPLAAHCRLVLRSATPAARPHLGLSLVNQFRKKLADRLEVRRSLFGRQLEGTMPPQPILTIVDFLAIHSADVEGIFRKSPKQSTVRALRAQLDQGQVPDFHQHSVHAIASLLKEYLRSIPGQLLLSGNFRLWIEVVNEQDANRKHRMCRNLLRLLPPSHTVLLRAVLRLLRRISATQQSKMTTRSLAVCIAPSLLENPASEMVDLAKKVPELAEFLIENAPDLFDDFEDDGAMLPNATTPLHQSTDSGLSDVAAAISESPDSALFDSPPLSDDADTSNSVETSPTIENLDHKALAIRPYVPPKTAISNVSRPLVWRSAAASQSPTASPSSPRRLNRHCGKNEVTTVDILHLLAFRTALSSQSSLSSQEPHSPERLRVFRVPRNGNLPADSPELRCAGLTYVASPDELRISDLIVSHKKKESTDSTKTLIARTDSTRSVTKTNLNRAVKSPSPHSSPTTEGGIGATKIASSAHHLVMSPKPTVRRALLSKNETLGLPPPPLGNSTVHPLPNLSQTYTSNGTSRASIQDFKQTPPSIPQSVRSSTVSNYMPVTQPRRATPYRPPRRNAPEIVSWSVDSLRQNFQRKQDIVPPVFDTMYANLESIRSARVGR
ncbi:hypothetical protein M3Y98_00512600 [Aphelenchoides besseyi]|nr:hypothetical protein M3Y98_00512600 [Aphelenchoides besseyi]